MKFSKPARKDALDKVLGKCLYTDDLPLESHLIGYPIGSPVAKGILNEIILDPTFDWKDYTIITNDVLKKFGITKAFSHDEPILVENEINYFGQPIVLIAHKDIKKIKEAIKHITFKFEEQVAVLGANINEDLGNDRVFSEKTIVKGNVDKAFSDSERIFEETYTTQAQEHYYLETQITVSKFDAATKTLNVMGSMQAPFNIKKSLETIFKDKVNEVVVSPITSGGAFGGREDYTTQLAIYSSLLSMMSGKTVKIKLDRQTDMRFSTKRHPSSTKIKVGIKEGKINAFEINFLLDGGAYETISSVVLNRAMLHVSSFDVSNIRVVGKSVKTNMPPNGAFRGFGAPQVFFASQNHVSHIIKILNLNEIEFLKNNLMTKESLSLSGQKIGSDIGLDNLFRELIEFSKYKALKNETEIFNKNNHTKKRGFGVANVFHGTGYTGFQDSDGNISIKLKVLSNGNIEIVSSVAEFGQGSHTVLPLIAANILKIPVDYIKVTNTNTKVTPNSGPTVASRTTSLLGTLTENACKKLLEKLGSYKDLESYKTKITKLLQSNTEYSILEDYTKSASRHFDNKTLQGDAYENYSQASILVLIEIDLITYNVKVLKVFGAFDVGKIIDSNSAIGQVHGGMVQGIGYALYEEMKTDKKGYVTDSLSTYILPTALEIPDIQIKFVGDSDEPDTRPKGLGELPIDGMAPAIASAIENALDIHFTSIPITPEKILEAIYRKNKI